MPNLNCTLILLAVVLASHHAPVALADADRPLVVYREKNGVLTDQSRDHAKRMKKEAKENGQIVLWLVLDYPYNVHEDRMTPSQIDAQASDVDLRFSMLLEELLRRGEVSYPGSGRTIIGPGCKVIATPKGLKKLLGDSRLLQIAAI